MLKPLIDGRFVLECQLEGKPCSFMIDTGSDRSRIGNEIIRALKLRKEYSNGEPFVQGGMEIDGQYMISPKFFPEDNNFNLSVINTHLVKYGMEPISGLIGIDYLRMRSFTFDYRNNVPKGCLNGTLGIRFNQVLQIARDDDSLPFIRVKIDGDENTLLLDTGSNCSSLKYEKDSWEAQPVEKELCTSYSCTKTELRIASNLPIAITDSICPKADFYVSNDRQILGMNAFKNLAIHYCDCGNYYIAN